MILDLIISIVRSDCVSQAKWVISAWGSCYEKLRFVLMRPHTVFVGFPNILLVDRTWANYHSRAASGPLHLCPARVMPINNIVNHTNIFLF